MWYSVSGSTGHAYQSNRSCSGVWPVELSLNVVQSIGFPVKCCRWLLCSWFCPAMYTLPTLCLPTFVMNTLGLLLDEAFVSISCTY